MEPMHLSLQLEVVKPLCIRMRALPSPQPHSEAGPSRSSIFDSGNRVLSPSRVQNSLCSTSTASCELRRTTRTSASKRKVRRPLPPIPSSSSSPHSPLTPSRSPRPLPMPPSSATIIAPEPQSSTTAGDNTISSPSILETIKFGSQSSPGSETLTPVFVTPCPPNKVTIQPPLLPIADLNELDPFPLLPNPHSDCRVTLCEILNEDKPLEPPSPLPNPHIDHCRLTLCEVDDDHSWQPSLILTTPSGKKSHPLDGFDGTTYLMAAITMKKILSLSPPEDKESCDEKDGDEKSLKGRLSRHWIREKRGRRREEHDFQAVLRSLRAL